MTGPCFTDCGQIGETLPDEPPGTLPLCLQCRNDGVLPRVIGSAHSDDYAATSSEFRPPQRAQTLHHDVPILLDGKWHYQQAPVAGGHDSAVTAAVRTVARNFSEAEAARRSALGILRGVHLPMTPRLAREAAKRRPR